MATGKDSLFNGREFDRSLAATDNPLPLFRAALRSGREHLRQRFFEHSGVTSLVTLHAWLIDRLIVRAWQRHLSLLPAKTSVALPRLAGSVEPRGLDPAVVKLVAL